jgi:hypothetical protein
VDEEERGPLSARLAFLRVRAGSMAGKQALSANKGTGEVRARETLPAAASLDDEAHAEKICLGEP